ncbi:MAG: hypothetical protein HFE43_03165 [Oscillospiraceae bacterium]|jgi:N-acetylglucosamine kinase-like BadF-type ATPase|nr:hypothetical protein [Oscillospiraceae bacterium]
MRYYMAFDGGGTKLQGILFDEDCRLLSSARTEGVNTTVRSREQAEENVRACIRALLEQAGREIPAIALAVSTEPHLYEEQLRRFLPCGGSMTAGEGGVGVLACGETDGICALSGTGSDIFYVEDGRETDVLGGWGHLLDDDGSGVWIGRRAVRSMMRCLEGIQEPGLLHDLLRERHGLTGRDAVYRAVYHTQAPAFFLGSCCRTVNEAAAQGDPTALEILRRGGALLAGEALAMLKKHQAGPGLAVCTTGSVFRHCVPLRERFFEVLGAERPDLRPCRPLFEPVVGALISCMRRLGRDSSPELLRSLRQEYAEFVIPEGWSA